MGRTLEAPIYKRIEWNLHNVKALKIAEKEIVEDVLYGSGNTKDLGTPRGSSKHSDPTAIKALALTDNKPRQWLEAIAATYAYFGPYTPEGRLARLFYGKNSTSALVSLKMQCTRQSVKWYRDNFVLRCAIHAAERGLIRLQNDITKEEYH